MSPDPSEHRERLKQALLAIQKLQSRVNELERAAAEPIAVTGIGCRFPGQVTDANSFWRLLEEARDGITEVPQSRWDIDAVYDPNPDAPGKTYTRCGGFVEDIDRFDAAFFGISPREARSIDPQHRMLLEVAWEALEHAGEIPSSLTNTSTGVFVGITASDYAQILRDGGPDYLDAYHLTGCSLNFIAGRLSHVLGLQGPAIALDTACSSSLVSVHLACQSLRLGECDLALAGGVNALLTPDMFVTAAKARMLAPDGRCKTFDAHANGYVRGEGCGVIVLRRMREAIARGDRILALILGSAVNQDGPSSGLTVPNKLAQEALIRRALASANVQPVEVGYVEAHGTGTPLGDPIEVRALAAVLGEGSDDHRFLLGSVKTNIGHLESAAGIAGLIKAVLALHHEAVPAHLHLTTPSPHIAWHEVPAKIPTRLTHWERDVRRRIASVSSFGGSGTNAHMIVQEAPAVPGPPATAAAAFVLPLSARAEDGVEDLASALTAHLRSAADLPLWDTCFTAAVRREHHECRAAVVGGSREELINGLEAIARKESTWQACRGLARAGRRGPVFVFSGQGSQSWRMVNDLLDDPSFRGAIDQIASLMDPMTGWSLIDELRADETSSRMNETAIAQPAILAVQVALVRVLEEYGIKPAAVVGHSVGEIAAALVGGALTLEQAIRIVVERGRIMQRATGFGRMLAVAVPQSVVEPILAANPNRLSLAAINGPTSLVLSGDPGAIEMARAQLESAGRLCRLLPVNYAFHSYQMRSLAPELHEALLGERPQNPTLTVVSTVTGEPASAGAFDAEYWVRNMTEPVQFSSAIAALGRSGHDTFVEIGAHPVLCPTIEDSLNGEASETVVVPTLHRSRPAAASLLAAVARLHVAGHSVNWSGVYPSGRVASLPRYPWRKERHWVERAPRAAVPDATSGRGSLLGRRILSPAVEGAIFETVLTATAPSFVGDHRIHGIVMLPATAYVSMALEAVTRASAGRVASLHDVAILSPLSLSDEPRHVQVIVSKEEFRIACLDDASANRWTVHASGRFGFDLPPTSLDSAGLALDADVLDARTTSDEHYDGLAARGSAFGPLFRGVRHVRHSDGRAMAEVRTEPREPSLDVSLDPAALDCCFQAIHELLPVNDETYLPVAIGHVAILGPLAGTLQAIVERRAVSPDQQDWTVDVRVLSSEGALIARIDGLRFRRGSRASVMRAASHVLDDWFHSIAWETLPAVTPDGADFASSQWVIFGDDGGVGDSIARTLESRGHHVLSISRTRLAGSAEGPVTRAAFDRLLAAVEFNRPFGGAVFLWPLDVDAIGEAADVQRDVERMCGDLIGLTQAMVNFGRTPLRLCLITRGARHTGREATAADPRQASLWGLARVLALEHPELNCRRVDLDPVLRINAERLTEEILAAGDEAEIALRATLRLAPRLERAPSKSLAARRDLHPVRLDVASRGQLDNLRFEPLERRRPGPGEVEIRVRATGLNFRDVLNVLGMYHGDVGAPGIECAGSVTAIGQNVNDLRVGDDVVGIAAESFATFAVTQANRVTRKPDSMSFAEAAAIPSAFMTARHALERVARVRRGERVLIHAAAGGVGLAAVQVAQRAGAEVFATAGSETKREYLRSLGVSHVMSSRTLEFAREVRVATGGRGVDIVLNSLTGDAAAMSVSALASGGRFIELGRGGAWGSEQVAAIRPDVAYSEIFLLDLFERQPVEAQGLLQEVLDEVRTGALSPLPTLVYPFHEAPDAFRYMAQARHIGKLVVEDIAPASSATDMTFEPESTYLITGGLGALGLEVARGIVERGGRHLLLVGRRRPSTAAAAVTALTDCGADVRILHADIARVESIQAIQDELSDMPPLRGVVHAAGVLDDGMLHQQDPARLRTVLLPKVAGSWHLHMWTRRLPLDFFVLFSGAASLLGSKGQATYAAANAFMDALGWHRGRLGSPALSIDWGLWGGAGMAASMESRDRIRFEDVGMKVIPPAAGVSALDHLVRNAPAAQVAVLSMDWSRYANATPVLAPFLRRLASPTPPEVTRDGATRLLDSLQAAAPAARLDALMAHVRDTARRVLSLPSSFVLEPHQGLRDVGLDSLMAVELRNALQSSAGKPLSPTLAFDYPTVHALAQHLASVLDVQLTKQTAEAPAPRATDFAREVRGLTDEEAEAQLAAELMGIERNHSHGR